MKLKIKENVKIAIVTFLIATILGIYIGHALTPTTTFTISPGVYPGAPDYTIWKEGSNYFAKNANGEIEFSGTDATTVIQQAINITHNAGGGTVLIKNGIYYPTDAIRMKSNVHLRGESRDGTILKVADGTPDNWGGLHVIITYYDSSGALGTNITISDLTVDTNLLGIDYTVVPIRISTNNKFVRIINVKIPSYDGYNSAAISLSNGQFGEIRDCIILNGGIEGGTNCEAIYVSNYTEYKIINNVIYDSPREGIYIGETCADYGEIRGNHIYHCDSEGIDLRSNFTVVAGNTFYNCSNGIWVSSAGNTISGNVFYGGTNCIVVSGSSRPAYYNSITGNIFAGYTSQAIAVEDVIHGISIVGNVVRNTGASYVFRLSEVQNFTITGNMINGTTSASAVTVSNCKYGIVSGNMITDANQGIYIGNSTYITVSSCIVLQSVSYGFRETGSSDYNIIIGCTFKGSGTADIVTIGSNTHVHLCWNGTSWIS